MLTPIQNPPQSGAQETFERGHPEPLLQHGGLRTTAAALLQGEVALSPSPQSSQARLLRLEAKHPSSPPRGLGVLVGRTPPLGHMSPHLCIRPDVCAARDMFLC